MKTIKPILLILLMICAGYSHGQYKFDMGIKFGGANYLGEIGGKEKIRRDFLWDMKLQQTNQSFGAFARYKFNSYFGLDFSINYGQISGDDALSTNPGRVWRNMRFKNNIVDFSLRATGFFYEVSDVGHTGRYAVDFKAYGYTGLTVFTHNPQGQIYGESTWYRLQPLQTEGVNYSLTQVGIPLGIGVAFTYKKVHRFGWNATVTTTFTDYLDDISTVYVDHADPLTASLANQSEYVTPDAEMANFQPGEKRGDPTHDDTYMFTHFYYAKVFRGSNTFYRQSYGWIGGKKRDVRRVRAKF